LPLADALGRGALVCGTRPGEISMLTFDEQVATRRSCADASALRSGVFKIPAGAFVLFMIHILIYQALDQPLSPLPVGVDA
jgi:hypothetical protein